MPIRDLDLEIYLRKVIDSIVVKIRVYKNHNM